MADNKQFLDYDGLKVVTDKTQIPVFESWDDYEEKKDTVPVGMKFIVKEEGEETEDLKDLINEKMDKVNPVGSGALMLNETGFINFGSVATQSLSPASTDNNYFGTGAIFMTTNGINCRIETMSAIWNQFYSQVNKRIVAIIDNNIIIKGVIASAIRITSEDSYLLFFNIDEDCKDKFEWSSGDLFDISFYLEGTAIIRANKAAGLCSFSCGGKTEASGDYSHAEGLETKATNSTSHAEGYKSEASGNESHAEGRSTIASGRDSHAEGQSTTASGEQSHAEGFSTTASGSFAHAEGALTKALSDSAHAQGKGTEASAARSFAGGFCTKATQEQQFAIGKYNATDDNALFIIGNGTADSSRLNIFTVSKEGKGTFSDDVVAGTGVSLILNDRLNLPATQLSSGADLNDYTEVGTYYCVNSSVSDTILNKPNRATVGFRLTVRNLCNSNVLQQEVETSGGAISYRTYVISTSTWSNWTSSAGWIEAGINSTYGWDMQTFGSYGQYGNKNIIRMFSNSAYFQGGAEVVVGAGGNTFVGGGESVSSLHELLAGSDTTLIKSGESYTQGGERLYLTSDKELYLCSNGNTITDRKVICMGSSHFSPLDTMALGTTSHPWDNIYVDKINNKTVVDQDSIIRRIGYKYLSAQATVTASGTSTTTASLDLLELTGIDTTKPLTITMRGTLKSSVANTKATIQIGKTGSYEDTDGFVLFTNTTTSSTLVANSYVIMPKSSTMTIFLKQNNNSQSSVTSSKATLNAGFTIDVTQ